MLNQVIVRMYLTTYSSRNSMSCIFKEERILLSEPGSQSLIIEFLGLQANTRFRQFIMITQKL